MRFYDVSWKRAQLFHQSQISHTSAIIIWQSNVPLPPFCDGRATCDLILVTTGAPKVMLGTKWPSITSMCIHCALCRMRSEHASPRAAKSALRIEGAMMAGGDMANFGNDVKGDCFKAGNMKLWLDYILVAILRIDYDHFGRRSIMAGQLAAVQSRR
jgi:hypothetical protein